MSKLTAPTKVVEILKAGFHVQVLFINQISGIQEPKTTVGSSVLAGGGVDLEQMKLKTFRQKLGKTVDSKWSFSFENCAPVEDDNTLLYYLSLVEGNMKKLQSPEGGDAAADLATLPVLTAYMAVGNSMAPPPTGFGATWAQNKKADVDFTDRSASALIAPILSATHKAEYITETASIGSDMVPTNGGMLDCVVDFSDDDWNKIMMLNKTLYAFDVRGKSLEVTSARLPAFELKLENQEVSRGVHLRPFVEINDAPHIDIAEVSTEFQNSLADNAFSARAVDTMVSGGNPMFSASLSAGLKSETFRSSGSSEGSQKKSYLATYNFPRVKLFLDETTLSPSPYLEAALTVLSVEDNQNLEELTKFQRKFGVIFAREVTLGGRLESRKAADSTANSSNSADKDALKASLGAAVSYGSVSASANGSMESQTSHTKATDGREGRSAVSYTARGGNTLLCTDPGAWAASVAIWRNWRLIKQDEPIILQDLIGSFEKYKWVPDTFNRILGKPAETATKLPPSKIYDANMVWTKDTRIRLFIADNQNPLWTFAVRDGISAAAGPRPLLTEDFPMLLFKNDAHNTPGADASSVYVNRATGDLGPQSDNKGPYRFTLRKLGTSGKWKPTLSSRIYNGDRVTLWCHSLGIGGWKTLEEPPSEAKQAMYNGVTGDIKVNTASNTFTPVFGYQPAEFTVEYI